MKKQNALSTFMLYPIFLSLLLFTFGCASIIQQKQMGDFNNLYGAGKYNEAALLELDNKGNEKSDPSDLLESLQAGVALRCARDYNRSTSIFDECEEIIKRQNEELLAENATSNIGAILVNDAILDYKGAEYDGIMVNTYKALNFWQMGDKALARVEFNRAIDRQRRAKERFSAEIKKQQEMMEKKQKEENSKNVGKNSKVPKIDLQKSLTDPGFKVILEKKYSNLEGFKNYPDFINPFTTYIAGLFFMSEGDFSKAKTLLKEAYGMMDNNPIVLSDFARSENLVNKQEIHQKNTWVIFENGLGPIKKEFRIDLPVFLFSNKIHYTGIALPNLELRPEAYSYLELRSSGKKVGQTCPLASMDRVVMTEFQKRYPGIVARAVLSCIVKTVGQYVAKKEGGDIGDIVATLYQIATTSADIRIWSALPKEFQVAKVASPKDGTLSLVTPTGVVYDVPVPNNKDVLVYVKIPTNNVPPVFDVIEM